MSKSLCYIISIMLAAFGNTVFCHPGVGIVADSKGNIYYSDLNQVWKVSKGKKSIAVANVHSHELFIDDHDNLLGEHLWYAGDASKKFFHFYWRLDAQGKLDTIVKTKEAYLKVDFSLALDKYGNQYFCKFDDSLHLYKRGQTGEERAIAAFDFRGVRFFFSQMNGELLFTKGVNAYNVKPVGNVEVIAKNLGSAGSMPWGVWQDRKTNTYVALFNDKVIKKIDKKGKVTEFYRSPHGWAPAGGVFDKNNRLWILEWSDNNEVRAIMVENAPVEKKKNNMLLPLSVGVTVILVILRGFTQRRKGKEEDNV